LIFFGYFFSEKIASGYGATAHNENCAQQAE
jgi:hypothetical protein